MNRTPLFDWHVNHGAKMVEYAGWELPVYYSSILEEHRAVRTAAGLFDVCHMGRVRVSGHHKLELLQAAFSNDLESMEIGQARYGVFCNANAGVIDDAIIYRTDEGYLVIPNAANREAVIRHLKTVASDRGWQVDIDDWTGLLGMFALQGPAAAEILQGLCEESLDNMRRFTARKLHVANVECFVARTGYTGEDGFEIVCPADKTAFLWSSLYETGQEKGLVPAGLGARDSLRIEACLPLYGNELNAEMNPLFAGLRPFLKFGKPDFIGKNAMMHWTLDDSTRFLAPFRMDERCVPRHGHKVHSMGGTEIGEVTSGLFSPTLNQGIGMAYIESGYVRPGTKVMIRIRDKNYQATVAEKPLYKSS